MKKILKRLGFFGLILAILIPFLDLPVVKAEECKKGMNVYLFLDKGQGDEIGAYESDGHRNYAVFANTFPANAEVIGVDKVDFKKNDAEYDNFYAIYNDLTKNAKASSETAEEFEDHGNTISYTDFDNIENVTFLIHGRWSEASSGTSETSGNFKILTKNTFDIGKIIPSAKDLKEASIPYYLPSVTQSDIGLARLTTYGGDIAALDDSTFGSGFVKSLNSKVLADRSKAKDVGYITSEDEIMIAIDRKITNYSGLVFGYKDTTGGTTIEYVYTDNGDGAIQNSYAAMKAATPTLRPIKPGEEIDFYAETARTYYWPEEYKVTYKVCNTVSPTKVNLKYDGNTSDNSATNVPAAESYNSGETVTVKSGASRNNYVFKNWCTEKNGTGSCYSEKSNFNITQDTTLYAQWGETGPGQNKPTGIVSYILGFASVGIVASGIYLISKKKNLFKQI